MPEVSFPDWNQFIASHPDAHVLQSGEWGALKADFGWKPACIIRAGVGAQVLFRSLPLGQSVAYLPKGPVGGDIDAILGDVDAVCRRNRAVLLKFEPDFWQSPTGSNHPQPESGVKGFHPSLHNIQPSRTIIVDLRGSEEDILARMKQKCRYNVRLAEKKGITIHAWDDLDGFHSMMLITGGRDGFGVHSREYYRRAYELFHATGSAELLVAKYEGKPLAALMVFARGRRSWYMYGASTDEERNRMPTYLLQWEAMRWARAHGCEEYDLWGVPDEDEFTLEAQFEDRSDGLWGVYRFKRGFGGEVRRAAQVLDRVYNPLLYRLYLWRMAGREGG